MKWLKGFDISGQTRRTDLSLALLLFCAGAFVRLFLIASTGFDGLYGQDAYAYYDFAGSLLRVLRHGEMPGAFFWPLGYPALLAGSFTAGGMTPSAGQMVNMLMGALLPPLVYTLARLMGQGIRSAVVAGLVMLVCGQALLSSVVLMADIPALFWATLSAAILWKMRTPPPITLSGISIHARLVRRQGINPLANEKIVSPINGTIKGRKKVTSSQKLILVNTLFIICGALLGLAIITRWLYLVLLPAWIMMLVLERRWRGMVYLLAGVCLALLPQILYSQIAPTPMLNHAWVEGWTAENLFAHSFDTVDGHLSYAQLNAAFYAKVFYDAAYLSPVLTPFLLIGALVLILRRRQSALFLMAWAMLPYLFLAGIPYQNARFALIIFPAAAVLTGAGVDAAIGWLKRGRRLLRVIGLIGLAIWVGVGLSQALVTGVDNTRGFISVQERDKAAAAWAGRIVPAGGRIYTFGLTLTLQHYTDLEVYEIYYETPDTLAAKWMPGQTDYLLLNLWNIENQWAGREPEIAYHWLRDQRGLNRLGSFGNYTLFRVRG